MLYFKLNYQWYEKEYHNKNNNNIHIVKCKSTI